MAFAASSCNISLVAGTILCADCRAKDGTWTSNSIYLDRLLGNVRGKFVWLGTNFHYEALDIRLDGTILHARLLTSPMGRHRADMIDLNERLRNRNGELEYIDAYLNFCSPRGQVDEDAKQPELIDSSSTNCDTLAQRQWEAADLHSIEVGQVEAEKSLSTLSPFKYPSLPSSTSFRLLEIKPADSKSEALQCSIITVEPSQKPLYDALSYTWGNPFESCELDEFYSRQASILCNGQQLYVGRNLLEALRRLRRTSSKEVRTNFDKTELIKAAEEGYSGLVQRLLLQGADTNARDYFGETALHYAAENGHYETVRMLVHAGSSLSTLDDEQRTPLDCAKQRKYDRPHKGEKGAGRSLGDHDGESDQDSESDRSKLSDESDEIPVDYYTHYGRRQYRKVIEFLERQEQVGAYGIPGSSYYTKPNVMQHRYIWIDALCINQDDIEEKKKQVSRMREIYSSARRVLVWLGREKESHGDRAVEDIFSGAWRLESAGYDGKQDDDPATSILQDPLGQLVPLKNAKLHEIMRDWFHYHDKLHGDSKISGRWLTGNSFFRRRWFKRAWVLQEIVTARDAIVMCGQFVLTWDVLVLLSCMVHLRILELRYGSHHRQRKMVYTESDTLYRALMLESKEFSLVAEIPVMALERIRREWRRYGPLPAINALQLTRSAGATDKRDKVFAVYSIMSPIGYSGGVNTNGSDLAHVRIVPDYTLSFYDVYLQTSVYLLEVYGVEVMSLVKHSKTLDDPRVPSWVVDLSIPLDYLPLGTDCLSGRDQTIKDESFKAESQVNSHWALTSDHRLKLRGRFLATIDTVSPPGFVRIGPNFARLLEWLEMVAPVTASSDERRKLLIMCLLCYGENEWTPEIDESFSSWIRLQSVFQLVGHEQFSGKELAAFEKFGDALKPQKSEEEIAELLETMETINAALGIEKTIKSWDEEDVWPYFAQGHFGVHFTYYFDLASEADEFARSLHARDLSRCFFKTQDMELGTGPELTQPGDMIYLIRGARVPYVLRPVGYMKFKLIGETYFRSMFDYEKLLKDSSEEFQNLTIV